MPYRPQLKTANGLVDFPLDAETVKGKTILEQTYPVGAIYISTNNTSPASLFGGTWQQIKDTFILAAGDTYAAGATGGEATHNHTLQNGHAKITVRESGWSYTTPKTVLDWVPTKYCQNDAQYQNFDGSFSITGATALGGSTDNANNMPPYLVAYVWKRTA